MNTRVLITHTITGEQTALRFPSPEAAEEFARLINASPNGRAILC